MDASVERHLFEPFFSSQSRSSGLGLFICRALCDGHGAAISYRRTRRIIENEPTDGNDFIISFAS
jgi:two-component system sensor histidine kinase PilS (NtrC family)